MVYFCGRCKEQKKFYDRYLSSEDCRGSLGDKTLIQFCALLADLLNIFSAQKCEKPINWKLNLYQKNPYILLPQRKQLN